MSSAPDLSTQIQSLANGPAEVSGDAGSVKQRSVSELIEADRYLASKAAMANPLKGLRFAKITPPGSV